MNSCHLDILLYSKETKEFYPLKEKYSRIIDGQIISNIHLNLFLSENEVSSVWSEPKQNHVHLHFINKPLTFVYFAIQLEETNCLP